jgi:hypothetical protein
MFYANLRNRGKSDNSNMHKDDHSLSWNGTDTSRYVPLVNTSRSFPHSWRITGFVFRLTRRVSLVERKLLTLPEHLSLPRFLVGSCCLIFSLKCMFRRSLFVLLCIFFWPFCCLFFFDIRILITLLVSSNTSYSSRRHRGPYISRVWLLFCSLAPKEFKIVWLWTYPMKVIQEARSAH